MRKAWAAKANVPPPRRVYPKTQPNSNTNTNTSSRTVSSPSNQEGERAKSDLKNYVPTSTNVLDLSAHRSQGLPKDQGDQELWRKLEELSVQEEKRKELEDNEEERENDLSETPKRKHKEESRDSDNLISSLSSTEPGFIKHPQLEVSAPIKSQYSSQAVKSVADKDDKISISPLRIAVTHAVPTIQQSSGEEPEVRNVLVTPAFECTGRVGKSSV